MNEDTGVKNSLTGPGAGGPHSERMLPRRQAMPTVSTLLRSAYPAWIESDEGEVALIPDAIRPPGGEAMVLRIVGDKKPAKAKGFSGARRVR